MLDSLLLLAHGVVNALSVELLLVVLIGVIGGLMVGALPGIGPSAGVAILMPIAIGFNGILAIAGLAAIYYGAMFGGAVTSILLGIPGDSSSVMTVLDGHAMAKKGQAGRALGLSVSASFVGGIIGILFLAILSVPISNIALEFGPVQMTALMVFALTLVSVLGGRNKYKGFLSLFIGFWLGMVGLDPIGGPVRYTFGSMHLFDGVDFTIIAVGLFGLSEIFMSFSETESERKQYTFRSLIPRITDMVKCRASLLSGSLIGSFVGTLPGAGATTATMLSYAYSKRTDRNPEEYGHGSLHGVASPEAANNAASYTAMIPLFTLGIPGSATTAVLLGGLIMIGIHPGPLLFVNHPEFVWTVFGTFWIGNIMLVFLSLLLIPFLASIASVRPVFLYPAVISVVIFGVYSIHFALFDVGIALASGVAGYIMLKLEYAPVPLVLGLVLGPMIEQNIRRTLIISEGGLSTFYTHPISLGFILLTVIVLLAPLGTAVGRRIKRNRQR